MKRAMFGMVGAALLALTACGLPDTFEQSQDSMLLSIELREDVNYERAWREVFRILQGYGFEFETISKDTGYVATAWHKSWSGDYDKKYRVRAIVRFAEDRKALQVKSEAQYGKHEKGKYKAGYDTHLIETLKKDFEATVGRVRTVTAG
jgi:uncharacterized lipoprotein